MTDEPSRHLWIWITYAGLFALAIPWYFEVGSQGPIWLGFPRWVTLSLASTLAIAVFTYWVIGRFWQEREEEDE